LNAHGAGDKISLECSGDLREINHVEQMLEIAFFVKFNMQ